MSIVSKHLVVVQPQVKPMPTVLQICASLGFGGSERVALQAAEALQQAGGRSLMAGSPGGLVDEIVAKQIKFHPIPAEGYNPLNMLRNIGRIVKIIEDEKVDIVHIHNRAPGWSAVLAAHHTKTPTVSTYHSAYGMNSPLKRYFNSVMAGTDRVIISSNYIGGYIDAHHGRDRARRVLIRNGMDLRRFDLDNVAPERIDALRQAWGVPDNVTVFIMPARFTRLKGHSILIRAAAALREQGIKNFICLFVGGDERREGFRQEIEQEMERLNVRDHIRITGPTHDMPAAYALADFAVSASLYSENLSLSLIEASAMGLPVIATHLGAAGEVILAQPAAAAEERTGWFVPPQNAPALSLAMREALNLPQQERERMGTRARTRMLAEFDVRAGLERTLELYRSLLHEKQSQNNANDA